MKAKNIPWSVYIRNGLGRRLALVGERTGQEWLIYNPLVMRQFHRHAMHNAPLLFEAIADLVPHATRILDIGCGSGKLLAEFARRGWHTVGLERSNHGRRLAHRQGVDCREFDLTRAVPAEVEEAFDIICCFEVAEHLSPEMGEKLVDFASRFRAPTVFSAAHPGQGGTGHVNEQPQEYWIERFARHGFTPDWDRTQQLQKALTHSGAALWFQTNSIVLFPQDRASL